MTVRVRVRNTVTVVCETASTTTVLVVKPPAATVLDTVVGGAVILALTTDLDKEGTTVTIVVLTLVWMDNMVVTDAGTLVVKIPFSRINTAGFGITGQLSSRQPDRGLTPVTDPSKSKLRVRSTEVVCFIAIHDSVALEQALSRTPCTQSSTTTLLGSCPSAISYQGAIKYANRRPVGWPSALVSDEMAAVGAGTSRVEVEKVTDCSQSVTEIGRAPSPESTVEHTAKYFRV